MNGNEKYISLSEKSSAEICQWINHLRTISGKEENRLVKTWKTENPSIQGVWTPYTNKDPVHSTIKYPSESPDFLFKPREKSATEKIIEMAEKLRLAKK